MRSRLSAATRSGSLRHAESRARYMPIGVVRSAPDCHAESFARCIPCASSSGPPQVSVYVIGSLPTEVTRRSNELESGSPRVSIRPKRDPSDELRRGCHRKMLHESRPRLRRDLSSSGKNSAEQDEATAMVNSYRRRLSMALN